MHKAAIYSPYLDTLGGGEKYVMTIAEVLLRAGFKVDVLLDEHLYAIGGHNLKNALIDRFALDLKNAQFLKAPVGKGSQALKRLPFLNKYEVFFYLTDGSVFYPTSGKNILHLQFPIQRSSQNIWEKIKLNGWDLIIYNSLFTQENASRYWPIKSLVVYPPVDTDRIKPLEKKKYILSVGRFTPVKKQSELIKIFKMLAKNPVAKGWVLNLAGSASLGDEDYVNELKNQTRDLPVKFYPNIEHDKLIKLYGESGIYWHAAGFGEEDPVKMEHFGISTVEAMAGGCVPVVIGKGGQEEIVENGKSGYLWDMPDQCRRLTLKLMNNINLREKLSAEAVKRARNFRKQNFEKRILEISKV